MRFKDCDVCWTDLCQKDVISVRIPLKLTRQLMVQVIIQKNSMKLNHIFLVEAFWWSGTTF